MDIQSFVFGMLTILGLILLVGNVVGFVKIYKHEKTLHDHEVAMSELDRNFDNRFDKVIENIEATESKLYGYADSRCDKLERKLKN